MNYQSRFALYKEPVYCRLRIVVYASTLYFYPADKKKILNSSDFFSIIVLFFIRNKLLDVSFYINLFFIELESQF